MYFGPGIKSEDRKEFWHGTIWSESPLFSDNTQKITLLDIIFCNDNHFVKICTRKLWKNKKIQKRGFGGWNLNKDNNNLDSDLYKAYCEEFNMFGTLNTCKVLFFDYISYVVMEDNDDNPSVEHNEAANSQVKVQ
ncbi:9546_t:CDS:2, partial [Cetraspora pellucida]